MAETTPSSIPTSQDKQSSRPTKRRALSPRSKQASHLESLFANPEKPIHLPNTTETRSAPHNLPPEIVANVQGSSAGAGSGEFHVYKASRRREYERLRAMDEEKDKEDRDREFEVKKREMERRDIEKTERNRVKREKAKARKGKKGPVAPDAAGAGEKAAKEKFKANVQIKGQDARDDGDAPAEVEQEEVGIVIHDED